MDTSLSVHRDLLCTESRFEKLPSESLIAQLFHAAAYSAIEAPASALIQVAGGKELGLIPPLAPAEFNSPTWYAHAAGSAIGMIAPFLVARGATRFLGGTMAHVAERNTLSRGTALSLTRSSAMKLMAPYLQSAATGAIAEGLLRPADPEKGNFWNQRINNGLVGAATLASLTAGNRLLKGVDAAYVSPNNPWAVNSWKHDTIRHVLSGAGAGAIGADLHALISEGNFATGKDRWQSAYTMALLGGGLRLTSEAVGRASGTRTISDIVSADQAGHEAMRSSPQARSLLLQHGDVRVSAASMGVGGARLSPAFTLLNPESPWTPRADRWDDTLNKKIAEGSGRVAKPPSDTGSGTESGRKPLSAADADWAEFRGAEKNLRESKKSGTESDGNPQTPLSAADADWAEARAEAKKLCASKEPGTESQFQDTGEPPTSESSTATLMPWFVPDSTWEVGRAESKRLNDLKRSSSDSGAKAGSSFTQADQGLPWIELGGMKSAVEKGSTKLTKAQWDHLVSKPSFSPALTRALDSSNIYAANLYVKDSRILRYCGKGAESLEANTNNRSGIYDAWQKIPGLVNLSNPLRRENKVLPLRPFHSSDPLASLTESDKKGSGASLLKYRADFNLFTPPFSNR